MRTVGVEVLEDPAYLAPEAPPADGGVAWVRHAVSRFCNGAAHERRRAMVAGLLNGISPDELREPYAGHPVGRLAAALGVAEAARAAVVQDVKAVAAVYQSGEASADAAADRLVAVFGGVRDERTAAHIAVLVQACDATELLIRRTRGRDVHDVLREEPPVVATRRVGADGEVVLVSLAGAPFGRGPRACPGREHALALVEGALR